MGNAAIGKEVVMGRSKQFDPNLESVPQARALVTEALDPDDDADAAALMTSELSANAVLHAGTPFTVRATHDEHGLTVAVDDHDPTPPQIRDVDLQRSHGRGLQIIDSLATEWGVTMIRGNGKTVWFRLDPRQPAG
jgi:anti-sigma regulatory factor (Ser/Thr protein kinase)